METTLWEYLSKQECSLKQLGQSICNNTPENSILIGYSMGGRIALHALLADPAHWKAAIIISAHPGLTSSEDIKARKEQDALWAHTAMHLPWKEFIHRWNQQSVLQTNHPPEDRNQLESYQQEISRSFSSWGLGEQENLIPLLSNISTPISWITGELDEKFTHLGKQTCDTLSDTTTIKHLIIKGARHRILWENPNALAQEIISALR